MATVRSSTARFLGSKASVHTRRRYKKDILTWQRFCKEHGVHALDGSVVNAQAFADWLAVQYTPLSVNSRFSGVKKWFDHLLADGIVKGHGFREAKVVKRVYSPVTVGTVSDADLELILDEAAGKGPRWEWLVGMVGFAGVDCAEALRVRPLDVRTWDGRTVVRVTSRRGTQRDVVVSGRLEVLTLGLAAVFAPTSSMGGSSVASRSADRRSDYASVQVGRIASAALGRSVTVQDLRRSAVRRQFERGVAPHVIAAWLGHATDRWVKECLGVKNPVAEVSREEVALLTAGDGVQSDCVLEPDSPVADSPLRTV